MGYQYILFEKSEGIATITMNRPEVLNAYIGEMGDELVQAFTEVRDDDEVRVVILTGAGRAFCAGLDLKRQREAREKQQRGESAPLYVGEFVTKMPLELTRFPKPVIAAMNGHSIGVGVTMALPCDMRIAAEDAQIGLPFTKLGMLPGLGSAHLLPKLVGLGKAMELVLTSRIIDGKEAERIGLVNKAVPRERVLDEARALARELIECNAHSLARAKLALHHGASATLEEVMGIPPGQS